MSGAVFIRNSHIGRRFVENWYNWSSPNEVDENLHYERGGANWDQGDLHRTVLCEIMPHRCRACELPKEYSKHTLVRSFDIVACMHDLLHGRRIFPTVYIYRPTAGYVRMMEGGMLGLRHAGLLSYYGWFIPGDMIVSGKGLSRILVEDKAICDTGLVFRGLPDATLSITEARMLVSQCGFAPYYPYCFENGVNVCERDLLQQYSDSTAYDYHARIFTSRIQCSSFVFSMQIARGLSLLQVEEAKATLATEREAKRSMSLILTHWKRTGNLHRILTTMSALGLFREVVVWNNNNLATPLNESQLETFVSPLIPIRVLNADNLKDEAKYRACAAAQSDYCYYQDDDWDTAHYAAALIESFRPFIPQPVIATDTHTAFNDVSQTWVDRQAGINAGFAWIGCGAVYPRHLAVRHVFILERFLSPSERRLADKYFTTLMNAPPAVVQVPLRTLGEGDVSFSAEAGFADEESKACHKSIQLLSHLVQINANESSSFPELQFPYVPFPSYVRAIGKLGEMTLISSMSPLNPRVPGQSTTDYACGSYLPDLKERFVQAAHVHAMDRDPTTCWVIPAGTERGHFFAVDSLHVREWMRAWILSPDAAAIRDDWDVQLSLNGRVWASLGYCAQIGVSGDHGGFLDVPAHSCGESFKYARFMGFFLRKDAVIDYRICEVGSTRPGAANPRATCLSDLHPPHTGASPVSPAVQDTGLVRPIRPTPPLPLATPTFWSSLIFMYSLYYP